MKPKKLPGKVFLVGAGPGDPGLLTVRGADLIQSADVIVVDDLVNPALPRLSEAKIIYVGKRGPGAPKGAFLKLSQAGINALLVKLAKAGQRVVRLKGGDPVVFGRGGEEMAALRAAHISYEIVPGVTSAIAAPAFAGIPISDRRWSSKITFLTGQEAKDDHSKAPGVDWSRLSPNETLVIFMGVSRWPLIRKKLLGSGWPSQKPVAAIESATTPAQRVLLTNLKDSMKEFKTKKLTSPSILVVGEVAKLSRSLSWLEKEKPLLGKTVVVTRAEPQAAGLTQLLKDKGADVVSVPAIDIVPLQDDPHLQTFYSALQKGPLPYNSVIFLSANGVRAFSCGLGRMASKLKKVKIFSVGDQTTAAIKNEGWRVFKQAQSFNAKGVLSVLGKVAGKRILIPRVQGGPKDFVQTLIKKGASVREVQIYRNRPAAPPSPALKNQVMQGVDAVTFTSASTVRHFLNFFTAPEIKKIFSSASAISLGPTTSAELKQKKIRHLRQAKQATLHHMVESVCRALTSK